MKTKAIILVVFMLGSSGSISARAEAKADVEAKAKADYEAADKAAKAAEAAVGPIKVAMQKADVAYANAGKAADAKRQQATDANNLAGEPGVRDLKQAETNLPAAIKALTDATNAKPPLDKVLAAAKAAAAPLQQAYDAAEKVAREAEAVAKAASDAANKLDNEAKRAAAQAAALRRTADTAKAALSRAQQGEQNLQDRANAAPEKLAEAEMQKKVADEALASAKNQVAAATAAFQAAEKAALAAEASAKGVSEAEKQQAAAEAGAKCKAADEAKTALTQAQQREQEAQAQATAAAQKLATAPAQKEAADAALAGAKNQVAAAVTAFQAVEQASQSAAAKAKQVAADASKTDMEKKQAADEAAAWRKAADAAKAALEQTQQGEKTTQAQVNTAAKNLADAPAQKKTADEALASAKNQVSAATTAFQSAEQVAREADATAKAMAERAGKSEEQKQQAAADAVAKRKAAAAAKASLAQAQAAQQNLQNPADAAAQKLSRAMAQKKLADIQLANVKTQVAAAATAFQAAEQAAQAAEKSAAEKKQAADEAAAKRKAGADAGAALAQAQQGEQQAQVQATAAVKALTDATPQKNSADEALVNVKNQVALAATASQTAEQAAQAAEAKAKQVAEDAAKPDMEKKQAADEAAAWRKAADAAKAALAQTQQGEKTTQAQATAAAQKLTAAQAQKNSADQALADAKTKVVAATTANQAAQEAASELIELDAAAKETAAVAAAKRKVANDAKAVLAPKAKTLEQAVVGANRATQALDRAQKRKDSAEAALTNLKNRIAAAKQTHVADDQAAKAAEDVASPLKVEAEETRAAYVAAKKIADDKRDLAEQAKAVLYRLVAARQVASLMESSDPPKPANRIDEIVFAKLNSLGIKPALCSDAVFLRRAYLDLTGTLPSAEEAKAFIQSSDKDKRVALIDRLLGRSAHVDYWAMRWSDILRIKAEFPVKVWPNAAQAYHRWVWESIAQNKPYDQFARELLTSSGSNYRVGAVNFYRAIQDKTTEGIASAVGLALMGTRVHFWPEDRRAGMAVFFSQVGYKPTSEWKEEIVFWDPLHSTKVPGSIAPGIPAVGKSVTATNRIPRALAKPLSENGPLATVFPDGAKTTIPPNRDPREVFADWLIRPENPWFAKAIVNRTWAWAMGRGIIHEPDDIREDNPPSNPELLAYLEKELVSSGYDLKHLKRLIFTSTAYQFSSIPRFKGPEARANFASYLLRRVEAEVLIDALNEITGSSDLYTSAVPEPFTYIPKGMSAVALADGSITSSFLTLFGRSARATGMENERVNELASTQWLHMLNSATIQSKLQSGPKLAAMLSAGGKPNEIAERLYLTILSRFPTDADVKAAEEHGKTGVTKGRDVWIDLAWALINSPEFLLRH